MRIIGPLFLLASLTAVPLVGQGREELRSGVRLRVTTATSVDIGTLLWRRGTTLMLTLENGRRRTYEESDIVRLERSPGRRNHSGTGILVGVGVGFGLAAAIIASDSGNGYSIVVTSFFALLVPALTAPIGAGIGALIRTERWSPIPPTFFPEQHRSLRLPPEFSIRLTVLRF